MQTPLFPAEKWNAFCDTVRRAWPLQGVNVRLGWRSSRDGVTIEGKARAHFAHPWQVRCVFERFTDSAGREAGEWRAYIRPGFVNARDAFLDMPPGWPDKPDPLAAGSVPVPLTAGPAPFLRLTDWRNPIASAGVSASEAGEILFAPGEGYPRFFERLGVKPAVKGGKFSDDNYDPDRTRELRAIDLVLVKPRLGSRLGVRLLDGLATSQTHEIETTFSNAYYVSTGGRAKVRATSKFRPFGDQFTTTPFLGLPMNAGDPEFDELKLATVYLVSPPDADAASVPDETWTPYAKNDVFWNVQHATRFIPPAAPLPPVRLVTGLGAGILDTLSAAMLAPINSGLAEVGAFLNQADMRGKFWTI